MFFFNLCLESSEKKSLFWILTNIISIPPNIQKRKKKTRAEKKKKKANKTLH